MHHYITLERRRVQEAVLPAYNALEVTPSITVSARVCYSLPSSGKEILMSWWVCYPT